MMTSSMVIFEPFETDTFLNLNFTIQIKRLQCQVRCAAACETVTNCGKTSVIRRKIYVSLFTELNLSFKLKLCFVGRTLNCSMLLMGLTLNKLFL